MKGFILGFCVASLLGAGLVWAQQDGYITDQYGQVRGYLHTTPPMSQPNFMGPANTMGQTLNSVLQNSRNPC